MNNIRVTYSGLIAFIVGLVSIVTGLIFILIITRNLSLEEFGTWSLINNMIFYLLLSESMIFFWTIRQIARGEEVGKTSVVSTLILSLITLPFYILASYHVSGNSNSELNGMLFAVILIPLFFLSKILHGITTAYKPQTTSYAFLIFEIVKIPIVLVLVDIFNMGLYGVVVSLTIAYCIQLIVQFYFAYPKLYNKLHFSEVKRWIKLSWISLYVSMPGYIANLDVLIYTLITGSVIGIAYYSISLYVASIIQQSYKITMALYPKLLAEGKHIRIQENLQLLLYFALPLLGIIIIFSKPIMFALNPEFHVGYMIVLLLAFKSFFTVLIETFKQILLGIDQVDVEKNTTLNKLVKSKLFLIASTSSLKSLIYLTGLIIILYIAHQSSVPEIDLVVIWTIIILSVEIPSFMYFLIITRRNIDFKISPMPILKYIGTTLGFILLYYMTSDYIIHYQVNIFDFLPGLILQFLLCMGVYLGITYAVDLKTRQLFKLVLLEIFQK